MAGDSKPLEAIHALAAQLPPSSSSANSANLNPLADLIALLTSFPLQLAAGSKQEQDLNRRATHTALHAIKQVFESLITQGRLHGHLRRAGAKRTVDGEQVAADEKRLEAVKSWINDNYATFLKRVSQVLGGHVDPSVRASALGVLMSLVRVESEFLTALHGSTRFATRTFDYVVRGLALPPSSKKQGGGDGLLKEDVKEEWAKWFDKFDDVRYYFFKQAAELVRSESEHSQGKKKRVAPQLSSNLLQILESLTTMPTHPSEINEWFGPKPVASTSAGAREPPRKKRRRAVPANEKPLAEEDIPTGIFDDPESSSDEDEAAPVKAAGGKKAPILVLSGHKKVFTECWIALLSLPIVESDAKKVLVLLHRQVLPHLNEPRRLMDWLVDCVGRGGTRAILALNGIFTLIVKHGLEYPDFYGRLYNLLDSDVLHVKYRPRFFRLLETFMSSSHLPATLVASFIKRLARLSLSAPPAALVTVIPFIYNLLKLHPSCMVLIHRAQAEDVKYTFTSDPFDADERDPLHTNAIASSIWEIEALEGHYAATVAGLAGVFRNPMGKQAYAMEDFLDHSYGTLFKAEVDRVVKRAPALAPVPKRQPIKDSLFPSAVTAATDDDPVDIVSTLWSF